MSEIPEADGDSGPEANATTDQLSVRLASDLRLIGSQAQLPSAQIVVGATRVSSDRVTVNASVDPGQPEGVPAGCYQGTVLVDSNGALTSLPIVVDLGSRENSRALGAFMVLVIGAGLGLTIKWITESLTPLAQQRRRLDRVRRHLRLTDKVDDDVLPTGAQILLDDAEDRVQRNDIAGLDDVVKPLEDNRASLMRAAAVFSRFKRRINAHEGIARGEGVGNQLSKSHQILMARIAEAEMEELEGTRHIDWPEKIEEIEESFSFFAADADVVDEFVDLLAKDPDSRIVVEVARLLIAANYKDAQTKLREPLAEEADEEPIAPDMAAIAKSELYLNSQASASRQATVLERKRRSIVMTWMLGHARTFAALASVLVVALIGLQVEYLNPVEFDNSLGAWLSLFLWALVVELSGVSILDVVARLGTAGASQARSS